MRVHFRYCASEVFIDINLFVGKPKGEMMTLPEFLHGNGKSLSAEYELLSKDARCAILEEYHETKMKDTLVKNQSNKSISKSVDARVNTIITLVCSFILSL